MPASPSRVAKRFVKKANPVQTMGSISSNLVAIQNYANMLGMHYTGLGMVWNAGDRRRQQRAGNIRLSNVKRDSANLVKGKAHGTRDYTPWISMGIPPKYGCTCPDFEKNSPKVGPCKHILALSGYWMNQRVIPAIDSLENKTMAVLEKAEYD